MNDSKVKLDNGMVVHRYGIIGTRSVVYAVYEPSAVCGKHSTITHQFGQWYGRVGTRPLTPELDALKAMSQERFDSVGAFHEAQYQEAYKVIESTFPEVSNYGQYRSMGEISISA